VNIETERLLLRELKHSDLNDIQEYATDPQVIKYLTFGPSTKEETKNFIELCLTQRNNTPRKNYNLGITLPSENKLIGSCAIRVTDMRSKVANIGFCLNRNYWGKGYATETAMGLLNYGFAELQLHRVEANCDPENTASRRFLEKIGMSYEGLLRQSVLIHGEHRDYLVYSILKQEWKTT
jgi:RimJ/RimL family protein N-acetyltransferase